MMSLIDQYVSQAKDHVRGRKLRRQHQHGHLLVQTPAEPPAATVEQVMTLTDLGQACGCCVGQTWPVIEELLAAK